jgi:3-hydroxybutyryl-CoA dehydrogenase
MSADAKFHTVGVIGAGTMGAGIAQVAAGAGHRVQLFDAQSGAADAGKARLRADLEKHVARARMRKEDADALLDRIEVVNDLEDFAGASLVVEAIVEDLEVKRSLFAKLEGILHRDAILATNTSSISITSIARGLEYPDRVAGMHFFNPAPVMKLVEIVSGVATAPEVAESLVGLAEAWGKVAVRAKSTPGFIVNRVARPFYAEALRLYEEQVADPATLDALLTECGGFRMGPFALMDLIGHDINYAVSLSVFNAYYQEPRFRPSITQLELVNAGRLGRKTGRGFFDYTNGAARTEPKTSAAPENSAIFEGFAIGVDYDAEDVQITLTDGRTARNLASSLKTPVIIYDLTAAPGASSRVGFAASAEVPRSVIDRFVATLKAQGLSATELPDWPGLVVMRTVAMLANEGFEAVLQGVADEAAVDAAMRFGVNYPKGPIGWAREIGLSRIVSVIDHIYELTRDPRYRASLRLRMAAQLESLDATPND